MEYTYRKKYINDSGSFVWIQVYDNGYGREVPAGRPDLIKWLQDNTPEEIPYSPHPLPDLETYKEQKKSEISTLARNEIQAIDVRRDPTVPEKLTQSMQISFLARFTWLFDRKMSGIELTIQEMAEYEYLKGLIENQIMVIQSKELEKLKAVTSATDYSGVDAVKWE